MSDYYFGKLKAVAYRTRDVKEAAEKKQPRLLGETGLIEILDEPRNSKHVLFDVLGNGTISTDAETVEIIDGLLLAYNRDAIHVFELDTPDTRSVCLNNEIQKLIVQVRSEPMPAQS